MPNVDAYIVFGVVISLIIILFKEWVKPALAFFIAILILLFKDIISPTEALKGFANEQLAVIVLLLILSNIFKKSTAIYSMFSVFLKKTDSPRKFLIKMMTSVGVSSAFFNNTPLVAMMMPYIYSWSRGKGYAPSKFLIPLSFASILGGCMTVIGTSTILIASGMAVELGEQELSLFSVTSIGLPMFVIGVVFIVLVSFKFLPNNGDVMEEEGIPLKNSRKFFFETNVKEGAKIVGKTINDAGLRNLEGLFLVEIQRGDKAIRPVSSNEVIECSDRLFFAGEAGSIKELHTKDLGITIPKEAGISDKMESIAEVVVSHRSQLSGKEVRNTNFRNKFDAAVLAIHRNGERVWGQLGRVTLKEGDVLLIMKGQDFESRLKSNSDLYVISNDEVQKEVDFKKVFVIFLGMIGAILATAVFKLALFKSLLLLLALSLVLKVAKTSDLKSAIDYNLILIIGLGLALGQAIQNSGAGLMVTEFISDISKGYGVTGMLIITFVVTSFLSAIITPSPAIAVILPVAIGLANFTGVSTEPFIICVALSAAANFITPIGYQTNLMVYGPGGYKFKDFFIIGFPLTLLYMFVCVMILTFTYNL